MKTLALTAIMSLFATTAIADMKTVMYPEKYCAEILSQEYSSGGGDTMWQYLEILCRDENGEYRGFVASWGSVTGAFGFGRMSIPDGFRYVPYDGEELIVD